MVEILVQGVQEGVVLILSEQFREIYGCRDKFCVENGFGAGHIDLFDDPLHVFIRVVRESRIMCAFQDLFCFQLACVIGI